MRPRSHPGTDSIQEEYDFGRIPKIDVAEEVRYWKDTTLLPHLVNLLSK